MLGRVAGEFSSDNFGWDVAGGADLDGNGRPDLVVSAKAANPGGLTDAGAVYVYDYAPDLFHLAANPDPLQSGTTADFTVSGGTPVAPCYLAYSLVGPGSYPVPQLNVTLGLANPQLGAGPNNTNAQGDVVWTLPIPPAGAGLSVWVQALQMGAVTNVVATSIQ